MKPTTIYLLEETDFYAGGINPRSHQQLFKSNSPKLPKSVGMGASGRSDLSSKTDELLWTEKK